MGQSYWEGFRFVPTSSSLAIRLDAQEPTPLQDQKHEVVWFHLILK
jgi:hypothetical protein